MELPLSKLKCEACRRGAPAATPEEIKAYLPRLPGWQIVQSDGIERLQRRYPFRAFADALAFTNRIGASAEEESHHPAILTEWGAVTVQWWTHKIGGLHRNDFIMAARSDELYGG